MFFKTLFVVLLGAAYVLAAPKGEHVESKVVIADELVERSIEDTWKKLENKFNQAVEQMKVTWKIVKEKGQKITNINLNAIKEQGLELLKVTKEVYKQIVLEGKEAAPEIKSINESLKKLAGELKKTGSEALQDTKQLFREIVQTVKEKFDNIKH